MLNFIKWIYIIRIPTLVISITNTLNAIFYTIYINNTNNNNNIFIFISCIIISILLQIVSNICNDYGDYINGIDNNNSKLGRKNYTEIYSISKLEILFILLIIINVLFLFSFFIMFNINSKFLLLKRILYILSIFASFLSAYNYSLGKHPYGSYGFGDISVFIFFGFYAVTGTFFILNNLVTYNILLLSISTGLLSTSVISINNIRDINNDKKSNKITIAVILGRYYSNIYQVLLLFLSIIFFIIFMIRNNFNNLFINNLLLLIAIFISINHIYNILFIKYNNFQFEIYKLLILHVIYTIIIWNSSNYL